MKISQSAKEKTKAKILRCAVDLIIEKGYKNASLREMAKMAGVSNPTIYNYFPSKEKILYAWIEQKHHEAIATIRAIDDFHTYSLREQLQTLIETELELYLEDREFLMQIFDMAFHSSAVKVEELYQTKAPLVEVVAEMIDIAVEAGEIEAPAFGEYLPQFFWDYYIAVVAYWIKDDSEMFENTTQFIDHSMGVIEALLHSNVLNRLADFGTFMVRTHLLSTLERYAAPKRSFNRLKRKLKGALHD
jgi:AcrR family transcriptional regulator